LSELLLSDVVESITGHDAAEKHQLGGGLASGSHMISPEAQTFGT